MACPTIGLSIQPPLSRFIYYKVLTLVPVSVAIVAMIRHGDSLLWPIAYVGVCLTHAAIMNAAKCPSCPYYKVQEGTFSCFIWWNTPKLWANREGREAPWVKHYALIGISVLTLFPVYWLAQEWPLLVVYFLGVLGLLMSIVLNECARCLHFECGSCGVPDEVRREYLGMGT
jgi:hypothetical protein